MRPRAISDSMHAMMGAAILNLRAQPEMQRSQWLSCGLWKAFASCSLPFLQRTGCRTECEHADSTPLDSLPALNSGRAKTETHADSYIQSSVARSCIEIARPALLDHRIRTVTRGTFSATAQHVMIAQASAGHRARHPGDGALLRRTAQPSERRALA